MWNVIADMWLADVIQLFTALAAFGSMIVAWRNSQKIEKVHISINSRMDQLLAATGAMERARGIKEERDRNEMG